MELLDALRAWAAQGTYVAAGNHVRVVETAPRLSVEIRKIVQARQLRLDRSYAGALIASFWNAFPWLATVELHLLVDRSGRVRYQPTMAAPLAAFVLPDGVRTSQGTFNSAGAMSEIAQWWADQDLYQTLCEDNDTSGISISLRRADLGELLESAEVDGVAVFDAIENAGRIDRAGSEPTYALAREVGHA